ARLRRNGQLNALRAKPRTLRPLPSRRPPRRNTPARLILPPPGKGNPTLLFSPRGEGGTRAPERSKGPRAGDEGQAGPPSAPRRRRLFRDANVAFLPTRAPRGGGRPPPREETPFPRRRRGAKSGPEHKEPFDE